MAASQKPGEKLVDTGRREKAAKGTVKVESDKGWLRLRFTHQGQRHTFALGLVSSKLNRDIASDRARKIELDILSGNFDETLAKYKPQPAYEKTNLNLVTARDLMEQFIKHKSKQVYPRTLEKYHALLNHLEAFHPDDGITKGALANKPAGFLSTIQAQQFYDYLSKKLVDRTFKEWLALLSACWQWGISQRLFESEYNPWKNLAKQVKVAPKQKPKPFSREEIGAIVQAFRTDGYYHYYADYVEFLLGTGCRTGEAIGLRWKHLAEDCSSVWIGESLSRGVRKPTKTNKDRSFRLAPRLQALLLARKPQSAKPDDLVFVTPKSNPIDDHNFRNRAWKAILARLEIDYRKPYNTRHSVISHALDLGMSPVTVADMTGHDVKTLYRDYAANVNSTATLPDLLAE